MRLHTGVRSLVGLALVGLCTSCRAQPVRQIQLAQSWQVQPGETIGGKPVVAGLGEVTLSLNGSAIVAPFEGKVQRGERDCALYSSPLLPGYLFRWCQLSRVQWGNLQAGEAIGRGQVVQVASLRKQPDGTWAVVEPAETMLERFVKMP